MNKGKSFLFSEWNLSKRNSYLVLAFSILAEQIGTACLEASEGYTILKFSVLTVLLYTFTYYTFCKILNQIDLAVAYATWSAVGSVGVTLIGILLFGQPMSLIGWLSIAGMILGVFLLNCFGTPKEDPDPAEDFKQDLKHDLTKESEVAE